jgi:rhamnosyltransferase
MEFGLVIPTLNAGIWLDALLPALTSQTAQPARIIVLDSCSTDNTQQRFRAFGARVEIIERGSFDHGGTRQLGVDLLDDLPIAVLLTQDAIPANSHAFENLLKAMAAPDVGLAYGRQLPRPGSGAIEAHSRIFNYPAVSRIDTAETLKTDGIRAAYSSNSFSAYRIAELNRAGGFPKHCIFGEDMIVAVRMMRMGSSKVYAADACVYHSHSYNLVEDFRRNFDVGAMHEMMPEIREQSGSVTGEGLRFVRSEVLHILSHDPLALASMLARTLAKRTGYACGIHHHRFSRKFKAKLSMNRRFWADAPAMKSAP